MIHEIEHPDGELTVCQSHEEIEVVSMRLPSGRMLPGESLPTDYRLWLTEWFAEWSRNSAGEVDAERRLP